MVVIHAFALTPELVPGESVAGRCESMVLGESTEADAREKALEDVTNIPERYEQIYSCVYFVG